MIILNRSKEYLLRKNYIDWCSEAVESFEKITGSGSNRSYYRIRSNSQSAIGVVGKDMKENRAFFQFTEHFAGIGLKVPHLLWKDETEGVYLLQDFGDVSLFDLVLKRDKKKSMSQDLESFYEKSLEDLIKFQIIGGKGLDFSVCYPRDSFDEQSIQWDLNYFKYYFLKLRDIVFDEQALEDDFRTLTNYLLKADRSYFMYRDFMTRNILIYNGEPHFIDYQGGRKGPLQYDLASILFQAKADLSPGFRLRMLKYYLKKLKQDISINEEQFVNHYYGFVLIRTLQVLGAYGFRGYYERKLHFLESIDYAITNLKWIISNVDFEIEIPELMKCFESLTVKKIKEQVKKASDKLVLDVNSFSYLKMEIPEDTSGHGGGFVFDCRSLPNPGRYSEYKELSGLDQPVIEFFKNEPDMGMFLQNVYRIIDKAVENYIERGFDHLMVSFGCTGGQHRSVYCAEMLFKHLRSKYKIGMELNHFMKDKWNK